MKDSSAYMIRLELLKLAQSIEIERSMNERIKKENDWNAMRDIAVQADQPVPDFPEVEAINHSRIIEIAKQLNEFVSKGE